MATNWRDEYKAVELAYMVLKDQYAELARELGSPYDSWWGDPTLGHDKIMERVKYLMCRYVPNIN